MGCGASQVEPPKKLYAFRVRLIGALNIFNNSFGVQIPGSKTSDLQFNGKSDPYVVLNTEGITFKSKTIVHEQNPVWNEDFYFGVKNRAPVLKLTVFDHDVLSNDDQIGYAELNLNGLIGQKERELWLPLKGSKANGEIGISVIECYRSKVCCKQGVDVKSMDTLSGSSDCYLTVQIGQQARLETAVKGWTLNPVWNQYFTFYVPYGIPSQLELILWDKDRMKPDENMGWCYTLLDGKPKQGIQEFKKKITNAQGTLEFSLEDDTYVEAPAAPPVTEEMKKNFPPPVPQTMTFQCKVVGAYNLAAADTNYIDDFLDPIKNEMYHQWSENKGTSDPFARVECESQTYDTPHINNTLEPWWNSRMRFVARNRESSVLKISVWDHDIVANDCIGQVAIPLNMMKPGEKTELWSFLDRGRGEIGLELQMDFQLKVRVVRCDNLPAKDFNGMCDPYVKLTLSGKTYQTRVCRDNRAPWIEEDFRWAIPTLKDCSLHIEVHDSDFMILKKGISEDLIGMVDVPLGNLPHGIPNEMTLPLKCGNSAPQGTITLIITDELPLPKAALDLLAEKGKEAFNNAVAKLTETADLIKTLKLPDFDKKQEGEVKPFDKKIAPRPRFSRINVRVVGVRGVKGASTPVYVGTCVPIQGTRYKSKEYRDANPEMNEDYQFRVPSKLTGALELTLFESNKHPYPGSAWSATHFGKAIVPFTTFNGNEGLIRGSPANDTWVKLSGGNGEIVVRVTEMFRFYIRVIGATGITPNSDPYVVVEMPGNPAYRTRTVSKDPERDRTEGIPGKPIWDDQFTLFSNTKGKVTFRVMDKDYLTPDDALGWCEFDLNNLRRGVPSQVTIPLQKGKGDLTVWFQEEEKMTLLDQMFDAATNAAKFAQAVAGEAAAAVADAASNAAKGLGNALGGLFR